jgi:RsiW-degrading membrane proteinase PrsW (M82 family)
LLVVVLLPVVVLAERAEERVDLRQRIGQAIAHLPEGQQRRAEQVRFLSSVGAYPINAVFDQLPGEKCPGAWLPRSTSMHWWFAAGTVALFGLFFVLLSVNHAAELRTMLRMAVISGSVGLAVLLLVCLLAGWSGAWWLHNHPYSLLLEPLTDGVAFSYRGALSSAHGLVVNFLGFALVVGLCEEVIKALPLLVYHRRPRRQPWRETLLAGLACGAAVGIVEGVFYCRDFHNGVGGLDIYLITFVLSVALQGVWTGCAAIAIHRNQDRLRNTLSKREYVFLVLALLAVPLMLHGLYDALIKMHQPLTALAVGVVSFVVLGLEVRRARQDETAVEHVVAG